MNLLSYLDEIAIPHISILRMSVLWIFKTMISIYYMILKITNEK